MNPLNFLRQAKAYLNEFLPVAAQTFPMYAAQSTRLLRETEGAIKFILPKGGRIFESDLRALPDELRLPFPKIVIEYEAGDSLGVSEQLFGEACSSYPKRIAYAEEMDGKVAVLVICGTIDGQWHVLPYVCALCKDDGFDLGNMAQDRLIRETNAKPVQGIVSIVGDIGEKIPSTDSQEQHELRARADTLDEANAVLSLIEALACINVRSERLATRKANKSAKKRGALPFDDYHVLTVHAAKGHGAARDGASGCHSTAREHLRRGHIRRLPDGRRVWVNSCVVNAGIGGKIKTDYKVAA